MKLRKSEKSPTPLIFLAITVFMFLILIILKPEVFWSIINNSIKLLITILPSLLLVFLLLVITNYFITKKTIVKHFQGKHGWLTAIIFGMLSSGPIYMWYPLLSDLKDKGLSNGFIATFLYNRSIKLPILPLMVSYFGIVYVIVLTLVMALTSLLQGLIINKITGGKNEHSNSI
ncbi:MAG: hypothetical protein KAQ83_01750 [Nanoarchaeota archaeon]|nr:hypothetical protein [Nanoarchaeota archaeon]